MRYLIIRGGGYIRLRRLLLQGDLLGLNKLHSDRFLPIFVEKCCLEKQLYEYPWIELVI